MTERSKIIEGCLIGTAIGDALGLHREGLSKRRSLKLYPDLDRYGLLFHYGMTSDDTEHTAFTLQALKQSSGDIRLFQTLMVKHLRRWFLTLPPGIGLSTLKSCIKLCIGISSKRSGVFSAGNGPAMRAAIVGAVLNDIDSIATHIKVSTQITHTDPKAEIGAFAIALAAHLAKTEKQITFHHYQQCLVDFYQNKSQDVEEFLTLIEKIGVSLQRQDSTEQFAMHLGLAKGVSGFVYHTVPVALYGWLKHQGNFKLTLNSIIACGGDTDTVAAIAGGIAGIQVGRDGIPTPWQKYYRDWPLSLNCLSKMANFQKNSTLPLYIYHLVRNVFFYALVIIHGLRRLLPPY